MPGLTFDSGALITYEGERSKIGARVKAVIAAALANDVDITVPLVALAEWWRGTHDQQKIIGAFIVEPMTDEIAKAAGVAMAKVRGATTIDAIVMASAALRGDAVYTTDIDDLSALAVHFPGVKVFRV